MRPKLSSCVQQIECDVLPLANLTSECSEYLVWGYLRLAVRQRLALYFKVTACVTHFSPSLSHHRDCRHGALSGAHLLQDPQASKPDGWDDDAPALIPDPSAQQPEARKMLHSNCTPQSHLKSLTKPCPVGKCNFRWGLSPPL